MKNSLRSAAAILAMVLAFAMLFTACAAPEAKVENNTPSPDAAAPAAENTPAQTVEPTQQPEAEPVVQTPESRTVTDTIGNEVVLPMEINRVAIISTVPLSSVFIMVEGNADKLVGMTPSSKNAAEHSFISKIAPDLSNVNDGFAEGDVVNVEAVLALEPDVVFYNSTNAADSEAAAKLSELGVPAVGFNTMAQGGNTIETFAQWATLMGEVMNKATRAEEIVAYGRSIEAQVSERLANLNEEDKVSALIIGNYTQANILGAGKPFGKYWLSAINTVNVAEELDKPLAPISLEQIYAWDPEVIFLNSFSPFSQDDILNSTAVDGHDWSGLTAVKTGRVYKMPLGVYYWFPPCSDSPLALMWLAKTAYPALFEDVDMDGMVKEYYAEFYGITLTDDDMAVLYAPPAEAAY